MGGAAVHRGHRTGAAGAAASQGNLNIAAVVLTATLAGELGGLIGYSIGNRWGRALLERPGKHQASRQRMVERGEHAYARWGRLAVFFTPAIVSGTAKMKYGQFVLWNFMAAFGFAVSVGASAYGIGRVVSGHDSLKDVGAIALAVGVLVAVLFVGRHRRARTGWARTSPELKRDEPRVPPPGSQSR